jgi:hypothetical protein
VIGLVLILFVLAAGSLRWWYGWPGWAIAVFGFVVFVVLGQTGGLQFLRNGDPLMVAMILCFMIAIVVFGDRGFWSRKTASGGWTHGSQRMLYTPRMWEHPVRWGLGIFLGSLLVGPRIMQEFHLTGGWAFLIGLGTLFGLILMIFGPGLRDTEPHVIPSSLTQPYSYWECKSGHHTPQCGHIYR